MRTITKETMGDGGVLESKEITKSTEGNSSVEITTDSKGNVKCTVKCYNDNIDIAKNSAISIWDELKDRFGNAMLGDKSLENRQPDTPETPNK